jgi:hypothetical protein
MRVALAMVSLALVAAAPVQLPHQGRVLGPNGTVLQGDHAVRVGLWTGATGGTEVWSESFGAVPFADGHYAVVLGVATPLGHDVFDDATHLEVRVDGVTLSPRQPLGVVPRAAYVDGSVRLRSDDGACTDSRSGTLRFQDGRVSVCVSGAAGWRSVSSGGLGTTQAEAAESCLAVHQDNPGLPSGSYWIDPTGSTNGTTDATRTWCDMTTDGGGWTLIEFVKAGETEGMNIQYSAVFSSVTRGALDSGSFKLGAGALLPVATQLRYTEQSNATTGRQDAWTYDFTCDITSAVRTKWTTPGSSNQVPASIVCRNTQTRAASPRAILTNYQAWSSCWSEPRLWIGSNSEGGPSYHGDYCLDCVVTWKCGNTTSGIYSGPSSSTGDTANTGAFWLR